MADKISITNVKIYPFDTVEAGGKVLAMAEIVVGDALLIRGFRIVSTKGGGIFVGLPSSRGRDGKWRDLIVAKDNETRDLIRDTILEAYKNFEGQQP